MRYASPLMQVTRWIEVAGRGIVVHAPEGSLAAARSQSELRELERVRASLERLLEPPDAELREAIHVYLIDAVDARTSGPPGDVVGAAGIIRTVDPEQAGEHVAASLAGFAIARWLGPGASGVPLLVDGVAGVVAAETGTGPAAAEADELVRSRLTDAVSPADAGVSVLTRLDAAGQAEAEAGLDPVATSFMTFLLDGFGLDAVRRFLAEYEPARRDESANEVFRQPLAALEAAWVRALDKKEPRRPLGDFLRHLAPLYRPYRWRLAEVGVWVLVGLAITVAAPLITQHLIDSDLPGHHKRDFVLVAVVLLGLYVGDALIGLRLGYAQGWINLRVLTDLQESMFARLQRLSHSYYTEARVGDVLVRLSQDLSSIHDALAEFGPTGLFLLLSAFAALGTLIYMSVWMGLLVLLSLPLLVVVYVVLGSRAGRLSHDRQQQQGVVASAAQENLSAHDVVKAYGLEEHAVGQYRARLAALLKVSLRMNLIVAVLQSTVTFAFKLITLLVVGVGGYLVLDGHFTLGTLVAFLAVLPLVFSPITVLSVALQSLQTAAGSMARVTELLDEQPEIDDRPGAAPLSARTGHIRLDGVTFGYDPERPVLHDLDLEVPPGGNVAIVGPSGSGKSTVVSLLMRFWDPQQGRVLYDGLDVREVTLASLRSQIGLVFQETFIFDTTVRENIALGKPSATDAEIRAAAEGARLDGWLETLPAGFDTILGERGVRMSGGQRQRLAIARALLRDPRILILDEATSALDARTEAGILETLAEVARGRTTIGVTHRLSLAATADRIFVLDQGRVVESGSHEELVRAGGLYRRLYEEQTSHVVDEGRRPGLRLDRLRGIPLLSQLEPDGLAAIGERLVLERFEAGELVARQGDPGDRFFLVTRGQLEVLLEQNGREHRVNTLNEGDFFGEMALLGDGVRAATVRTTTPADVYSLSRADLRELMDREPAIRTELTDTIAERRRALEAALSAVGATPADAD